MRRAHIFGLVMITALLGDFSCSDREDSDPSSSDDKGDAPGVGKSGKNGKGKGKNDGKGSGKDSDAASELPSQDPLPQTPKGPAKPKAPLLFTYIWIANSSEGTISKINTRTLKEEGRYQTRPDTEGNPSRTSVGISGDVVVANRHGGVTKVYANIKNCPDKNGDGEIQTSTGKDDVLDWGEDECIAWHTPMEYGSQRVAAWTYEKKENGPDGGKAKPVERVWVTGIHEGDPNIYIHLLDGKTGEILDTAETTEIGGPFPYGAYGGAVDKKNDLWFSNVGTGKLVRVSYKDLTVKTWPKPYSGYGITVDPKGRVWICGTVVARFTPDTEKWDVVKYPSGRGSLDGGCMIDGEGRLWYDVRDGVVQSTVTAIDIEKLKVLKSIKLPEHPHGISIDFDGNVWGVGRSSSRAYRINPETEKIETVEGLVQAYTYSDMTGFALGSVQEDPPV